MDCRIAQGVGSKRVSTECWFVVRLIDNLLLCWVDLGEVEFELKPLINRGRRNALTMNSRSFHQLPPGLSSALPRHRKHTRVFTRSCRVMTTR